MSKHEAATLACRILSIYFFAQTITTSAFVLLWPLFSLPFGMGSSSILSSMAPGLIQALAQTLVGFVLWRFAPTIAERIFP